MTDECDAKSNDSVQNISILSTQRKQNLASWGLPDTILKHYEVSGVVSMFPWQVECLSNPRVLEGGNLIYSAPTSAGKTLVAEILTIKTILERKKKVIIILPFVSVVREKMFYFQDLLSRSGVRVEGLMGSHSLPGGFKSVDIAICTIEKANSLINKLLEERSLHKVGTVVVDELHLLSDPFRGYLLELLLTKILYMCTTEDSVNIQVVGMSATIPNLALLAKWLGADLYRTDFRPVPLKEFLKVGPTVYDNQLKKLYDMQSSKHIQDDPDHVVQLCLETLINGHSVLVFCATKQWCEKLSQHIAKVFRTIGLSGSELGQQLREQLDSNAIAEALEQLHTCPVGLDKVLRCTVAFGVAFHHAGLTLDERDILEGYFRSGALRVLVATSTLSSGVNLPARRVIVRSPVFHGKSLDSQTYRQMIGRAGRMGRDTAGESFLICNKGERHMGEKLVGAELKSIESCLGHGELAASLKRAILEVIASGVACTPQQVTQYTNCTLLAATKSDLRNPISACVKFLEANELIRLQEEEERVGHKYVPTPLGLACLAASLPPDEGLLLFDELQRARQCLVLDTELHIIYEVTPYSVCSQWGNLDWLHVLNLWEQLSPAMRRVGELVGIDERFMARAMRGTLSLSTSKQLQKMSVHRRFYTALALHDLVNEVPLPAVAKKFGCSRGMLQSLQQSAATFAGMVTAFCRRLGWSSVELLVSQFQDRLQFGVQRELCDLMRLDGLNGLRARALFDAGICTLADLAVADVCAVENALHKAVPFQSCKELDGETSFDTNQRKKLRNVWITGHQGLTEREAASLLISDARSFLQKELGLSTAKWDDEKSDTSGHDNQSLSEQSMQSSQEQSLLHDKTSKHSEQTDNRSSISCHFQAHSLLREEQLRSKSSLSETNKRPAKHKRKNSLPRNKIPDLNNGIGKTDSKYLLSEVSDEDYVSSSPSLNSSQDKSSQRHISQKLRSKLGKAMNSKMISWRISQNTSAKINTGNSQKNISCKISDINASKPHKAVPIFTEQFQCNKIDNTHSKRVDCSPSEERRGKQNLPRFSPMLHETSDDLPGSHSENNKSSSEVNQSIDYFGSLLEISESKLHEQTQQFKQNNKSEVRNESSPENVSENVAIISNVVNNRELCLRPFVSSFKITDNTVNKNNEQFTNVHGTNVCLSDDQGNELLEKDAVNVDQMILKQNINPSLGPVFEKLVEKDKVTLTRADNKRRSSDFFSSPVSGGKIALDVEGDIRSPSLFGDSLVMDTQLNNLLDVCYCEHQTTEGDYMNQAQDCNQVSFSNQIQQAPQSINDQCLSSMCSSGIILSKDGCVKSGMECHKVEEESSNTVSCISDPEILNTTKLYTKNVKVGEVNFHEDEVNDKIKRDSPFKKVKQLHSLSKGFMSAREVMKGQILNKTTNSSEYHPEVEDLEFSAASNIVRDSIGRKGIILHLSTDTEVSGPHRVYSEEIDFHSVNEQTAVSHIKSDFKTKKGLVSPVTYHFNEKLQEDFHKSNRPSKETLRKKRKISTSSDYSYSEHEFINRKRKRISSEYKFVADEHETNCAEMVFSVLNESFNAEHWLNTKNTGTSEANKNFPPEGQCPDENEHFPTESQGAIHVPEQNIYTEKQMVREKPNAEVDHITESFLRTAFDTYWDLDTENSKTKRDGELQHDLGAQEVSISTSKTNLLQKHALVPPSVFNITQKSNKPETENEVISADSASSSQRCRIMTKAGSKVDQSPFVISNSLFEAAFSTCWEENPEYKEIKREIAHSKQNVSSNAGCNLSVKDADIHNNLRHQELHFDNRGSDGQSSSKTEMIGCGRRRSPRLMAAAIDREKRNSRGKSIEKVTEKKNTQGSLKDEHNEDCPRTFSAISIASLEVLENKSSIINKKLHPEEILQDCSQQCHLQRPSNMKMGFPEVNMNLSPSSHVQKDFTDRTETPVIKGSNSSSVSSPTFWRTKANKMLQLSSDSNSDAEEADDLITSSQGDDSGRKRGCDNLDKVRWKMSERDIRSMSKSPTHSRQQLSTTIRPISKHTKNRVSPRKAIGWDSINIVDVCGHERIWTAFQSELTCMGMSNMAIAVACERFSQPTSPRSTNNTRIGARIIGYKKKKPPSTSHERTLHYGDRNVSGIAVCFGGNDVFYISLKQGDKNCVGLQCKLDLIQDLLARKHPICAFDLKEHLKALVQCCGIMVDLTMGHDPKVADWLLEPESREKNLHAMVLKYCGSIASNLVHLVGSGWGVGSPALDWKSTTLGSLRACVEAVLTWQLVEAQCLSLEQKKLDRIYAEVEMPALLCLAQMELNGIGFSKDKAERLRDILEQQLTLLEQHAYKLAGHTFSLTSPTDVSKVLYRELGLATSRRRSKYRRPSTNKEALMQIKAHHPLPGVIIQWRKLNAILAKTLHPLLAPGQTSERMFTSSVIHTATGRISMHEPNLQNIPREFKIEVDKMKASVPTSINIRLAFVPGKGKVFVSADYCQLELRLLAHLAKDSILCSILNSGSDVFRSIAATWNQTSESDVTTEQRQWAKQVCYGMIYGMGTKALGDQLEVEEEDASVFMDSFRNAYPGVKQFLLDTVTRCRKEGYVETLFGRRRYLPTIHSSNATIRAQAERQAINSTVQGSAADIAKKGMVLVQSRLRNAGYTLNSVASLALHLHDELLYEVCCEHALEVAQTVQTALENVVTLSVQLPVKMKVGETWGSLQEITF